MHFVRTLLTIAGASIALSAAAANASSSAWHTVEGADIRLLTSGAPDEQGLIRGALEIRLKPGWKTYWRDPGDSGVPPTLDLGPGSTAKIMDIAFPAPKRFDDGYALWAGYDEPVSLAVTLRVSDDDGPLEASAFLGVCETICIPVQAKLAIDPASEPGNPEHAAAVAAAFAAVPKPAEPDFEARLTDVESAALAIEADVPDGIEVIDIFVASTRALALGTPEHSKKGDGRAYTVPIVDRTPGEDEHAPIPYTLVTTQGAVSGTLTLP
jgi:DsbC/DsbD-like thiol-disulfide interchange protein